MDAYSLVTYIDFTYKNKFSNLTEGEFAEAKGIVADAGKRGGQRQ